MSWFTVKRIQFAVVFLVIKGVLKGVQQVVANHSLSRYDSMRDRKATFSDFSHECDIP